uniref:Uncharacterized protein ycf33 n=1 Tax=Polysiphonia sertularioides TaxID=945028 RepID=A0A1Z1M9I7_9FLOR|nr:hypothetical protein [Polysiphonia sertularioides]ARW62563.1 hypothetical protein [Polysiphonia sertularioides]
MSNFWINLYKFPRFLIGVMVGFFLTTFQPIFKLLNDKNKISLFTFIIAILIGICYKIIIKMLNIE